MESLALHTGAPTVNWEEKISCISVVGSKRVTPRVKDIDIPVYFLQKQFDDGLFIQKYDNSSFMPLDMCTKLCSGPIITLINKWTTGFRFYTTSKTKHYQFMILHKFIVN